MAFEVMKIAGVSLSALRAENPALCGGAVGWIAGFASRCEEELDGSRGDGANVRFAAAQGLPDSAVASVRCGAEAIEN
jgi:class 3 adenylate cyclase